MMLEHVLAAADRGRFSGDRMRAWNTIWGQRRADLVIENGYVDVKNERDRRRRSRIEAEGKFSLGFPRKDGGEEINAKSRITPAARRSAPRLRARRLADRRPHLGRVPRLRQLPRRRTASGAVDREGIAYGETVRIATAALRFEGTGVRLDTIQIAKGTGRRPGGVGRLGRQLLVQRRRREIPVESLTHRRSRGRRSRASSSSTPPARDVRGAALRRQGPHR